MANYKKLGKNMLSLTIGSFGSRILTFFFVPFYTAVLSTEEYGIADLITTTVSLLFPFFSLIICEALLRFAQEKTEDKEQIFSIGMITWAMGFVVMLFLSPLILLIPTLKAYYILVLLYYFTFSLNSNVGYFIRGIEKVNIYSISGIINTLFTILLNLLFLLVFKTGVIGYLLSFIISNFIATVFMIVAAKLYKYHFFVKKLDLDLLKRMLAYSLPLIPNSASWWVSNSSDKFILSYFAGVAANGIYSVAYKIPTIITMVTGIFTTAWRLSAVEKFGTEESKKFYSSIFNLYITLTALMSSCLMVLNKPLSHFLYSKDFYQAWQYVPILLIASVVHSYSDFFGTIYTSVYKTKMIFYSTLGGAITNICLNFALIPKFEAFGAAIATLISYFVVFTIRMIDSRKIMKLTYDVASNLICVCVLLFQLLVSTQQYTFEIIVSPVCLLGIFFIRGRNIKELVKIFMHKKHSKPQQGNDSIDDELISSVEAYAGYCKQDEILMKSASGGAAVALYNSFIDAGGIVYGVGYSLNFKQAVFFEVTDSKNLQVIQGTKYIHSKKSVFINGEEISVFERIAFQLQADQRVLFVGLGCDVGALLMYCEKKGVDTSNLFTVDLICHGPTLPSVQKVFVEYLEKKYKSKITSFSVRYKKDGWVPPYVYAKFENGKEYLENWYDSDYCYAFGHFSREACSKCNFKGSNHKADITIGDFWGIESQAEEYNKNGVSVLLVRTKKGKELLSRIKDDMFQLYKVDSRFVIANNPMYYRSRRKDSNHSEFQKNLEKMGLKYAVSRDVGVIKYLYWKIRVRIKG